MLKLLGVKDASKRIYGLDILRAWAIIFVMFLHGKPYLPQEIQAYHKYFVLDGVSIFFVLSGFLIGGILIKLFETKVLNWNLMLNFWIRRWFRTLPNYFLILIVLILLAKEIPATTETWKYFLFIQNLWYPHPDFFGEAWSLSIEEWFYLTIPFLAFLLMKIFGWKPKQTILFTAVFVLIAVTAFRYYRWSTIEMESFQGFDIYFRKQVITRLDSLMYGIIGAYTMFYFPDFWKRLKVLFLFIGLACIIGLKYADVNGMLPARRMFNCVFSMSIFSVGVLLILPYLSEWKKGKGVFFQLFTFISLTSYSMYLVNFSLVRVHLFQYVPIHKYIHGVPMQYLNYIAFWLLTMTLSAIIYRFFEIPTMSLRDSKWIKNRFPVKTKEQDFRDVAPLMPPDSTPERN